MSDQYEQIRKLIANSTTLSSLEKAEWVQLLSSMNDNQLASLTDILTPPAPPAPQRTAPNVDIRQKEISTSVPFFEPEIAGTVQPSAPKAAAPQPPPVTIVPQKPWPQTSAPKPPVPTRFAPPAGSGTPAAPQAPVTHSDLVIRTVEDFKNLDATILHGSDPRAVLKQLLDLIAKMAGDQSNFSLVYNFEQSPLYKTYVTMGIALLNDPTKSRDEIYAKAEDTARGAGNDYLTKDEFEAFTDFRKELDKLIM